MLFNVTVAWRAECFQFSVFSTKTLNQQVKQWSTDTCKQHERILLCLSELLGVDRNIRLDICNTN